jgi:hypothetical protein
MSTKKIFLVSLAPLFCASLLFSQSLVEIAKKEKERREKFKGKKSIVVTNDVLKNHKIEPALSVKPVNPPIREIPAVSRIPKRRSLGNVSSQAAGEADQGFFSDIKNLEEKWKKAREYAALLSLKMNALWQEYYSLDDMTPRDHIQRQISDTYIKLQKAQKAAEQAKKDLEEARRQSQKR